MPAEGPGQPYDRGLETPRNELEEPELDDEDELLDFEEELELDEELFELEEELLEDELELDDDELLELEGDGLPELELEDGLGPEDEGLEDCPSGPATFVAHPPSIPTPARATLPDRILRNSRRSPRRVASSLVDRVSREGLSAMSTSGGLIWQTPCQ